MESHCFQPTWKAEEAGFPWQWKTAVTAQCRRWTHKGKWMNLSSKAKESSQKAKFCPQTSFYLDHHVQGGPSTSGNAIKRILNRCAEPNLDSLSHSLSLCWFQIKSTTKMDHRALPQCHENEDRAAPLCFHIVSKCRCDILWLKLK